jgi:hypothetical protein
MFSFSTQAAQWAEGAGYIEPAEDGPEGLPLYDQPDNALLLLKNLRDAHGDKLRRIPLRATTADPPGEAYDEPEDVGSGDEDDDHDLILKMRRWATEDPWKDSTFDLAVGEPGSLDLGDLSDSAKALVEAVQAEEHIPLRLRTKDNLERDLRLVDLLNYGLRWPDHAARVMHYFRRQLNKVRLPSVRLAPLYV